MDVLGEIQLSIGHLNSWLNSINNRLDSLGVQIAEINRKMSLGVNVEELHVDPAHHGRQKLPNHILMHKNLISFTFASVA